MKQKKTNTEKLYHLLFQVCTSEENKYKYINGAYLMILSVMLIMNDNSYKDIREIINPNEIKTFCILNQLTGKKIIFLAKDIKSSSYRHGELRVNRYKTVVNEKEHFEYKRQKEAEYMFEKVLEEMDEDEDE